jgi:hypothetical protein
MDKMNVRIVSQQGVMMKKLIKVSQATINEAIARRTESSSICDRCVITIALRKAFKAKEVHTNISTATVDNKRIELPEKVRNITIRTSDYWLQLKPFSFTVNV